MIFTLLELTWDYTSRPTFGEIMLGDNLTRAIEALQDQLQEPENLDFFHTEESFSLHGVDFEGVDAVPGTGMGTWEFLDIQE